jgi:ELWxxDGT repeat protein
MRKILLIAIAAVLVTVLYACGLFNPPATETASSLSGDLPALSLAVQAQPGVYNTVGQPIPYSYVVTNIGNPSLAGPVTITDDKVIATCPAVNTVGDKDDNLETLESLTCVSSYAITQADLNAGLITSNATAKAGGTTSNTVTTVVQITLNKVLTLTYAATPATYNQAGQTINFTFSIKNTGAPRLGPAQFTIKDDRMGVINCLSATTILGTNEAVTCSAAYPISVSDMTTNQLTFTGTASGGGAGVIQPASITIVNTSVANPSTPPSGLTRGATIQHKVVEGEWMLQITRCYGADFNAVRNANLQVLDPAKIWPINTLTIPNIGSNGPIYGPPCITRYTAQSGDTWNSIAQKFNADIAVLQEANPNVTVVTGTCVRVPLNSAGGASVLPLTITPCSGTTPPSTTPVIRINIPAGSTSTTVPGSLTASGKVRYVIGATQGQSLSVKLTAPVNEVSLGIIAANGSILKTQDTSLTFTGTVPATGDSYIDIFGVAGVSSKTYTLEISLTTPQTPSAFERVADINTGAGDSNPAYLSAFNGTMYFKATGSDNAGAELWKYDLGLKAVSRVQDINPGAPGSDPSFLTPYNNALYFGANNNDGAGIELFRFNGSAVGRVGDINSAGNGNPTHMAVYNNLLYFSANGNDGAGVELWKTDGTAITRATDIHPGTGDSNPAYLAVYNNLLYFSATSNDGAGTELWKFDGTTATRVLDINNGVGNSNPSYLAVFNNMLYFSANGNDGAGTELWRYDGTTAGRVADVNPGAGDSGPTFLTVFNNALYFGATGDSAGTELWKYDGTTTKRVSDLNTAGNSNPAFLAVFDNALFFQANAGDGVGVELWKFKGP